MKMYSLLDSLQLNLRFRGRSLCAVALLLTAGSSSLHATSNSWSAAGGGNWIDASNWLGGVNVPGGAGTTNSTDIATFNTGSGTVVVDSGRNVSGINFNFPVNTDPGIFTFSGGPLVLTTGGSILYSLNAQTASAGSRIQTFNTPITIQGNYAFTNNQFQSGGSPALPSLATNTLVFGSTASITSGATSGNTVLTLNGTNVGNNRIDGLISNGSGTNTVGITKSGAGTWILGNGSNSFSGGVNVNGGILRLANDGSLGASTNAVGMSTGRVLFENNFTSSRAFNVSGANPGTNFLTIGGQSATLSGTITISGGTTGSPTGFHYGASSSGSGAGTLTVQGTINLGNTGGVLNDVYAQTGHLIFDTSSVINSQGGGVTFGNGVSGGFTTTITARGTATGLGAIRLNSSVLAGSILNIQNGANWNAGANMLDTNLAGAAAGSLGTVHLDGGTLTVGGITKTNAANSAIGIINMNGGTLRAGQSNANFVNIATANAGTGPLANSRINVRAGGARIDTNGHNITIAQALQNSNFTGDTVGAADGGLIKLGAGVLTLTGASDYNGTTTVSAGTLRMGAGNALTAATGAVLVSGGRFDSNVSAATLGGHLNLSATGVVDPNGTGIGSFSLASDRDFLMSGGTLELKLGGSFDQIVSLGGSNANFAISGGTFSLDVTDGSFNYGTTYLVLSGFGGGNSVSGLTFTGYDSTNYVASLNNAGVLSFTAVPEPSPVTLILAGVVGMFFVRRARRSGSAI